MKGFEEKDGAFSDANICNMCSSKGLVTKESLLEKATPGGPTSDSRAIYSIARYSLSIMSISFLDLVLCLFV